MGVVSQAVTQAECGAYAWASCQVYLWHFLVTDINFSLFSSLCSGNFLAVHLTFVFRDLIKGSRSIFARVMRSECMNLLQNNSGSPRVGRERAGFQFFCLSSSCIFFEDSLINKWIHNSGTPFVDKSMKFRIILPLAHSLTIKRLFHLNRRHRRASPVCRLMVRCNLRKWNLLHLNTDFSPCFQPNSLKSYKNPAVFCCTCHPLCIRHTLTTIIGQGMWWCQLCVSFPFIYRCYGDWHQ